MTFRAESKRDREYMVWMGPTRAMMPLNIFPLRAAEESMGLPVFLSMSTMGPGMELPKTSSRDPGGL